MSPDAVLARKVELTYSQFPVLAAAGIVAAILLVGVALAEHAMAATLPSDMHIGLSETAGRAGLCFVFLSLEKSSGS